ncbi:XapX domain-containing protein [Pseudoxanthomonas sp. GM95]|uniref:XapX domain-containing protein n=1 Tax=Pseudoxanthomonas sp. GM95 TaxID=1881043 RepID=UPI0008D44342|nr:XapX domain-containing protein [Pseudoxanthomonas sp. GM95]SEL10464.1 XapX domain-containing protein [Pseudoxanthomonas sp. GM95]
MKPYLLSLAAGLLVGVIYSLLNVRSPAPPVIALVGLLGILVGEQLPPLARQVLARSQTEITWVRHQVKPHMFGHLPKGKRPSKDLPQTSSPIHGEEHDA